MDTCGPAALHRSRLQQLPDLLEGLLPAGLPVAANDAVRLAVLLQPMAVSYTHLTLPTKRIV